MRAVLLRSLVAGLFFFLFSGDCFAQEYHMLETETAYTVGLGSVRTEIEAGIIRQPDSSDLINFPTVRAVFGLSEWADLEFEYGLLVVRGTDFTDFEHGKRIEDSDEEEGGDLRIKLKVVPYEFGSHRLGFQFTTKLPNVDQSSGLGTNEADFASRVLFSTDLGKLRTHVNIGMALTGDPSENREHDEFILWGVGGEYALSESLVLMGEVEGSFAAGGGSGHSTENIAEGSEGNVRARVRAGLTGPIGEWRWGLSAFKGVNGHTEDWGVQTCLSKTWGSGWLPGLDASSVAAASAGNGGRAETNYNPLRTRTAYTISERAFQSTLGFAYIKQPDDSDLYVFPGATFGWGIGPHTDFQINLQYLRVEDTLGFASDGTVNASGIDEDGIGDVRTMIKISPFEIGHSRLGVRFLTKVPLSGDKDALGTGEIDFSATGLLSTDWSNFFRGTVLEPLRTHVNAGIAIRQDNRSLNRQSDYMIWGVATEYRAGSSVTLWAEIEGSVNAENSRNVSEGDYGGDYAEARLGVTGPLPRVRILHDWTWGLTASGGLNNHSRDYSATLGFSRTWGS